MYVIFHVLIITAIRHLDYIEHSLTTIGIRKVELFLIKYILYLHRISRWVIFIIA